MNFHLDYLLDLAGVSVASCTQVEGNISLSLEILANGINCPHCGKNTEQMHQNRRRAGACTHIWSSGLSQSPTSPILLCRVSAIQHPELKIYRLAKTTYTAIRRANLSRSTTIKYRTDWARRRNKL